LDVIPIAPKTGGGERQKPTILMRAPLMKKWLLEPALRKQASSEERRLLPFRPPFFSGAEGKLSQLGEQQMPTW
jgi:hypothetical protein